MQAPIVKIAVRDGQIAEASFYTPALPDGEHDLYVESGDARIAELEKALRRCVEAIDVTFKQAYELPMELSDAGGAAKSVL